MSTFNTVLTNLKRLVEWVYSILLSLAGPVITDTVKRKHFRLKISNLNIQLSDLDMTHQLKLQIHFQIETYD